MNIDDDTDVTVWSNVVAVERNSLDDEVSVTSSAVTVDKPSEIDVVCSL